MRSTFEHEHNPNQDRRVYVHYITWQWLAQHFVVVYNNSVHTYCIFGLDGVDEIRLTRGLLVSVAFLV